MSQIILIRHSEKDHGIHLSEDGYKRSLKIENILLNKYIHIPDILIAMKQHNKHTSVRPIETIEPIANKLGLTINSHFEKNELNKLMDFTIQNIDKNILICWEHSVLMTFLEKLTSVKLEWLSDDYSTVIVVIPLKKSITLYKVHNLNYETMSVVKIISY